MDLYQFAISTLAIFLLFPLFSFARFCYKYWRLCSLCSKLPTFKGTSIYTWPKWAKYVMSFKNVPPSVFFLQFPEGLAKFFPKGIYVLWILFPIIFIHKASILQELISHPSALDKARFYQVLNSFFGTGLVTSGGETWKRNRKLLTPTFHWNILKDYIRIHNKHSAVLVENLKKLTNEPWIEIAPLVKSCSFDILIECAMGLETKCQEGNEEGKLYIESIDKLAETFAYRMFRLWTHNDSTFFRFFTKGRELAKALKCTRAVAQKIIQEKKEEILSNKKNLRASETDASSGSNKKTFIEILFEMHFSDGSLSLKDIEYEINTFIIAGYDTISTALKFILYLVGLDQEIQKNITQELDSIFQMDRQRMATHDDLNNMKYLDCVIKESLRLYPPVPFLGRELYEDVQVGNYTIPKDSILGFNIYTLHRDPDVYPNPEKFDPERFFPQNNLNRHPLAFIPFAVGPRNCIGKKFAFMEMKVVLSHVFRNFTVVSLDPRDRIKLSWEMVLKNVDPIRLRVIQRP